MGVAKKPRVLFFDIETSYMLARVWRVGPKIYITHEQIVRGTESDIICICWKWGGVKKVYSLDWGIKKQDSGAMVDIFTREIERADIAIAHNGVHFDVRHINTQRLLHNQSPIAWPVIEDSLRQLRKYFYLPSYKLDYLANLLMGDRKNKMACQSWVDVVEGKDHKAFEKMIRYCKKDVVLMEGVFNKTSAFLKPITNAALIVGNGRFDCPRCGSGETVSYGVRRTLARAYQRRQCSRCGCIYIGPTI